MSTPASSASVEMRSAPAGVTCCQRMSPLGLIVHAAVAPLGAGAAVCACEVAHRASTRGSERSVRRGDRATMAILRWPPISPREGPERNSREGSVRQLTVSGRRRYGLRAMHAPLAAFIEAACVPLDSGHVTGVLERAEAILAAHPEVASSNIHTAAILGDDAAVRRFLAVDPANATSKGGPRGWDALTHLCFSRYLRLDRARSDGFVRAAKALLDAGASANTGFYERSHQPHPEWESALYGAAGVAHNAELTRLLLERGADPNDGEVAYHTPEGWDNAALKVLVESGKLNEDSLTTILLRKTDWHDYDGIRWLLEHGVAPNRTTRWGKTALHNAVLSDNALEIFEVLLDHGAEPTIVGDSPARSPQASSGT